MKRFNKKLDNYFTDKLIRKIREYLKIYNLDFIASEYKDFTGEEVVYLKINRRGMGELKEPRTVGKIYKNNSYELLSNDEFLKTIKEEVELELEMLSKGL